MLHYGKKAAVPILGIICFLLSIATAALGDPPQAEQADGTAQVSPSDTETAPDTADAAQPEGAKSDSNVNEAAGAQASATQENAVLKKTVSPETESKLSTITLAQAKVAELKKTNPSLISRIIAATRGLVSRAFSWLGTRYVWGGISTRGVDCSGLTRLLYMKEGIRLPHSAKLQFKLGQAVVRASLLPGDLVFFNTRGPISHVGMYIGNGKFIHAANPRRGVRVDSLSSAYFSKRFAGARRYKKFG